MTYAVSAGGHVHVASLVKRVRELSKIDLYEISLVERPADAFARVDLATVKSIKSKRDAEDALRDAGFSREGAKAFLSHIEEMVRHPGAEAAKAAAADSNDAVTTQLIEQLRAALHA